MQTMNEQRKLKEFNRKHQADNVNRALLNAVHSNRDTWVWIVLFVLGIILGCLW